MVSVPVVLTIVMLASAVSCAAAFLLFGLWQMHRRAGFHRLDAAAVNRAPSSDAQLTAAPVGQRSSGSNSIDIEGKPDHYAL